MRKCEVLLVPFLSVENFKDSHFTRQMMIVVSLLGEDASKSYRVNWSFKKGKRRQKMRSDLQKLLLEVKCERWWCWMKNFRIKSLGKFSCFQISSGCRGCRANDGIQESRKWSTFGLLHLLFLLSFVTSSVNLIEFASVDG